MSTPRQPAAAGEGEWGFPHEELRRAPTTLEGWRAFVDEEDSQFELLPEEEWRALAPVERLAYDEARMLHHSQMLVVQTAAVKSVARQGRLLTIINRRERGARRGMIVSGPQTTGKSTAIQAFGRMHELRVRAMHPGSSRIPVVYVTTPPASSPRKLAAEFARFLGLGPIKARQNVTDIAEAVCQMLIAERCDVILVDEIHNLDNRTSAGADMSDHLKYFTEHIPATFIYAGIDVDTCGLFTGPRGKQLAGRCVMVTTSSFAFNGEWRSLVASLDGAVRLHRHEPGALLRHARYLHGRTGGMIGSLSHLVRAAAELAILEGTEKIDLALLKETTIDYNAEFGAPSAAAQAAE